ncbi:acyl-CoA synthetase [Candidatus Paraluminiphilus aquimaris]|uniref:Acyl-CoA synthetase n=1 Tax=Candidatus Paraluminiphilus aquimaris TaxID=2518994 RepID=A0ABY6Q6Z9_9GAMM|nr:acyl-CoA synthetase [Candidatus Paraluminiphilus aquimaris]UZP74676.1 acyl-CoA synthetase [Candidatus Paraluminiphilus aquimaris]
MPTITEQARATPDKPAFIMGASGEVVTFAELDAKANQIAQLLRASGIQTGQHIAMMLKNCREFIEVVFGCSRAGVVFTPISTHLKKEETAYIINNCNARLFIASASLADVATEAAEHAPELLRKFIVGGETAGFEDWQSAVASQPSDEISDQSLGVPMLYSSGTTGKPKGIFRAPQNTDLDAPHPLKLVGAYYGFSDVTVYLSPAPLYHSAPLFYNTLNMTGGGTSVIMDRFDPEQALALIERYEVTHSQWVPSMFIRMLKLPEGIRERYDVSSMQRAIHAAAPCPIDIKRQMINWWGPVICEYYSSTEGVGFTLIDSEDWLAHPGSVGRPLTGVPKILDDEMKVLPPGEVGQIYFDEIGRFEYFDEPGKTDEAFDTRGWGTVGDMGYLDADGYLYLTDRKNFMIITGGVNVYPAEIEGLLVTHPQIADAAVFGIPNEEYGEEVKAVVQLLDHDEAGDALAGDLILWMKERLSSVKVPKSVDFMEQLPRMDNGKLYKRHLMEAYK